MSWATIWKYPLAITDMQVVVMPEGARVLSVGLQGDTPTLWALVDPAKDAEPRRVWTVGTGNPAVHLHADTQFVGTMQTHGGALVWHIFVDPSREAPHE